MLPVTGLTAAILALPYVYLSIFIIRLRRQHQVSIGDGGHHDMAMAIRAHGNFSEYVPISLVLMACAELNQAKCIILIVLALLVVAGRACHARAFLRSGHHIKFRKAGMIFTFSAILLLSIYNLLLLALHWLLQ